VTPELSIAVRPEYRGCGVGTRLLEQLLVAADREYDAVSLSVSDGNPAVSLYRRAGFMCVSTSGGSSTMRRVSASPHPPDARH
jgi:ribosomal protein S18 acetylase RimI-like enzyme